MLSSRAVSAVVKAVHQPSGRLCGSWSVLAGLWSSAQPAAAAADLWLHRARAEQQVEVWPVFTVSGAAVQPADVKYLSGGFQFVKNDLVELAELHFISN